jgi:hypothetical protein
VPDLQRGIQDLGVQVTPVTEKSGCPCLLPFRNGIKDIMGQGRKADIWANRRKRQRKLFF